MRLTKGEMDTIHTALVLADRGADHERYNDLIIKIEDYRKREEKMRSKMDGARMFWDGGR